MGTWGSKSFENDDALDWLAQLLDDPSVGHIEEPLWKAMKSDYSDAELSFQAIAAAEVVAVLCGGAGSKTIPRDLSPILPLAKAVQRSLSIALEAVRKITVNSELRDLWQEGNDDAWLEEMKDLSMRLAACQKNSR